MARLEEMGRDADEQLLGKLFAKQGLKTVPVDESFRADFFAQARAAREQLAAAGKLIKADLLQKVLTLLADYRAEHRTVGNQR